MGEDQRALPQIIDRQRRQHQGEPGDLDRPAAEMSEIGIERLGAGDGEEHRAERIQADHAVLQQEIDAVERIERPQHAGIAGDPDEPGQRDRHEPDQHDRAEQGRDFGGAARLHREQHEQDDDRQRHDIFVERRRRDIDAFDRGQHRQCRRDDGIAIEQRRADDAEQRDDAGGLADAADGARGQRHQRERAALPVVVGAQQDHDVFQRDDDEQRPQDQRHHAEHGLRGPATPLCPDRRRRRSLRARHKAGWCRYRRRRRRCCRAPRPHKPARERAAPMPFDRHFAPGRGSAHAICHEF